MVFARDRRDQPLLHSFQVKVPSVCPLTGLVAVLLVMPVSGTKVTRCAGEQGSAASGLTHEDHGSVTGAGGRRAG